MKKKTIKIGFPMEYEDDDHVCHYGIFLRENEKKAVEEKLQELERKDNNWNELKKYLTIRKRTLAKETSDLDRYARLELNNITDKIKELEENENI